MGTASTILIPAQEVTKPHRGVNAPVISVLTSPSSTNQHHITDHSYRAQGLQRINEDIARTQTATLGLAGEEAELLPTESQADSSPDGVRVGVRVEPALHGLAQHVPQGDLRAVGHL